MELNLKDIEDKFEILHKISEGGMGAVYKVRHRLLDEISVIKVIRPQHADDEELRQRFLQEARIASRLRHPNIAAIRDFFVGGEGTSYLVMEHIKGTTLKQKLAREGPLALPFTLDIARQTLEALSYLHRQGFVHRDVSPDNVMVSRDFEGRPLAKLIDLGIVKHLDPGAGSDLTSTGMFLGKARYSSPEQISAKGDLDQRTDIYSFGVMFYEMLTGHSPIEGDDISSLVAGHLFRPPIPFETNDPNGLVPAELRRISLWLLEKKVDQRAGSAREVLAALEPQLGSVASSSPPSAAVTVMAESNSAAAVEERDIPYPQASPGPVAPSSPPPSSPAAVSHRSLAQEPVATVTAGSGERRLFPGLAIATLLLAAGGIWWFVSQASSPDPLPATGADGRELAQQESPEELPVETQGRSDADDDGLLAESRTVASGTVASKLPAGGSSGSTPGDSQGSPSGASSQEGTAQSGAGASGLSAAITQNFRSGLVALNQKNWPEAARRLRQAALDRPDESAQQVDIANGESRSYLPHFYLGIALYKMNNYVFALDSWQTSERQGVIQRTQEYAHLQRLQTECDTLVIQPAIDKATKILSAAQEYGTIVADLLEDASLRPVWQDSPAVVEGGRRLGLILEEVTSRFETARRRRNLRGITEATQRGSKLKDQLVDLANRMLDLSDGSGQARTPNAGPQPRRRGARSGEALRQNRRLRDPRNGSERNLAADRPPGNALQSAP